MQMNLGVSEPMKLSSTESDQWSIKISIVYSDGQELSRVSSGGPPNHLLPKIF